MDEKELKKVYKDSEMMEGRHVMGKPLCEVCGHTGDNVNVVGSVLAAASFAMCTVCLEAYAEPYGMFVFTYEMTKGEVNEMVTTLCTYDTEQDKYITWGEFVEKVKDYPSCECGKWKAIDTQQCIDCEFVKDMKKEETKGSVPEENNDCQTQKSDPTQET